MSSQINSSIIISTYNQPDYLQLILKSLATQEKIDYTQHEVIIADDGSKNDTAEIIHKFQENYPCTLKHIWHPDDGFRKAMILNKAAIAATGDYLIFIDGDCIVGKDFVANQLNLAEPGYYVAGDRVLLSQQYTQEIIHHHIDLQRISTFNWFKLYLRKSSNKLLHCLRLGSNGKWRKLRQKNWRYPKGCNIAVWKSDYIAVNGYDEIFVGWGHEDTDFFIRLIHNRIFIKNGRFSAPVYHLWHKFSPRDNEQENLKKMIERSKDTNCIRAECGISSV